MVEWNPQWDRLPYCTTQLLPVGKSPARFTNPDMMVCAPSVATPSLTRSAAYKSGRPRDGSYSTLLLSALLSALVQKLVLNLPSCCAVLILCMFEAWPYRRWPVGNSKPGFLPMLQGLCASQLMVLAVYTGPYTNGGVVRVEAIAIYAVAYVSSPCICKTNVQRFSNGNAGKRMSPDRPDVPDAILMIVYQKKHPIVCSINLPSGCKQERLPYHVLQQLAALLAVDCLWLRLWALPWS